MRAHRCLSDGRRSCSCGRGVRRRLLCARDPTHATRGAACVVPHLHGLWGRRLGREALVLSCITTPPHHARPRLPAPAGGAHARRGCVGAAPVRPSPNAHATRGAACVVPHLHGHWGRRLGREALCRASPLPLRTTAAPAGGAHAHAGGGGCGGGSCAPETKRTSHAVRHVSCRIRMAFGRAGWAARRPLCRASPPPHARPRPRLAALMRAGVCGGGSCAPETQRTRHTR